MEEDEPCDVNPQLQERDVPLLSKSRHEIVVDGSEFRADVTMGRSMLETSVCFDPSDPFEEKQVKRFLRRLQPPLHTAPNYFHLTGSMPPVELKKTVQMGTIHHSLKKLRKACFNTSFFFR